MGNGRTDGKKLLSEDEIKARLRELTEATKRVREALNAEVRRPEVSATRRFLHRRSWPDASEPVAHDRLPGARKREIAASPMTNEVETVRSPDDKRPS